MFFTVAAPVKQGVIGLHHSSGSKSSVPAAPLIQSLPTTYSFSLVRFSVVALVQRRIVAPHLHRSCIPSIPGGRSSAHRDYNVGPATDCRALPLSDPFETPSLAASRGCFIVVVPTDPPPLLLCPQPCPYPYPCRSLTPSFATYPAAAHRCLLLPHRLRSLLARLYGGGVIQAQWMSLSSLSPWQIVVSSRLTRHCCCGSTTKWSPQK